MNNTPVVFLAFAQDHARNEGYLRNLKKERIALSDILRKNEEDGQIELVVEPDVTIQDIFRVFSEERYRNRIAVFHYAGHASGRGLHVEGREGINQLAHAAGLTQLFSFQKNLQFVFLNGCSTEEQVQGLKKAGVDYIIATSRSIADDVALSLARQFYQTLGEYCTIQDAFDIAKAYIETEKGADNYRAFFRPDWEKKDVITGLPWKLWVTEGKTANWQLNSHQIHYGEQPNFKVFLVYAEEDKKQKNELLKYLKPLSRRKQIDALDTAILGAGTEMRKVLDQHFKEAKIVLLLLTPNFMASDDCYDLMQQAMDKHEDGVALVIPILMQTALIEDEEFLKLEPLPRNRKFVNTWEDESSAYTHIAKQIKYAVDLLKK